MSKIILVLFQIKLKYLFSYSIVRVEKGAKFDIGSNVKIKNSFILVKANSLFKMENNASCRNSNVIVDSNSVFMQGEFAIINHVDIKLTGQFDIGRASIIQKGNAIKALQIIISNSSFTIGKCNMIRCERILVRFGGQIVIGDYTNINEGSELRADEKIQIGSYNQISFNCMIWDTNTHNIYPYQKRRSLTEEKFPNFGYEYEKPKTRPITIGDDCWIGREAALLKGAVLGDKCIVGFRTVVLGNTVPDNHTIVSDTTSRLLLNKI
ncbi:acyltransferase [Polaribacter sp. Q13]|uniref:acyltransferase n=1 Tax=Polaribacter sp. Q13 TaxID=2806551 RepID=UPI00193C2A62|nr:acyltransferase [Polaribacter sp. Q13]QVY66629.1 acyltransferase [Polaribacter sp. Q13]